MQPGRHAKGESVGGQDRTTGWFATAGCRGNTVNALAFCPGLAALGEQQGLFALEAGVHVQLRRL